MERLAVGRVEAAQMLGVSVRTLDSMLSRKELRGRRIGRRIVFAVEDLKKFLNEDHPYTSGRGVKAGYFAKDG